DIGPGDKVVVWFAAGNRDADHYPDPHRLDVARNPTDHLTFGRGGPHQCWAHIWRGSSCGCTWRSWWPAWSASSWPASRSVCARTSPTGSSSCRCGSLWLELEPRPPSPGAAVRIGPQRELDHDLAAGSARAGADRPGGDARSSIRRAAGDPAHGQLAPPGIRSTRRGLRAPRRAARRAPRGMADPVAIDPGQLRGPALPLPRHLPRTQALRRAGATDV